jgi:hypothetical protein
VVDVGEEGVQRRDPLAQAAKQLPPFGCRDDARHHVEGDQPLGTGLLAVNGEGDADAAEQQVCLGALLRQPSRGDAGQPAFEFAVVAAHPPVGIAHLVESGGHGWGVDPGWQPVEAECSHRTSKASLARPWQVPLAHHRGAADHDSGTNRAQSRGNRRCPCRTNASTSPSPAGSRPDSSTPLPRRDCGPMSRPGRPPIRVGWPSSPLVSAGCCSPPASSCSLPPTGTASRPRHALASCWRWLRCCTSRAPSARASARRSRPPCTRRGQPL